MSGNIENGGEVVHRSRAGGYLEVQQTLSLARAALYESVHEYDDAFETYIADLSEVLKGATIIVADGTVIQKKTEGEEWQQKIEHMLPGTEMVVDDLTAPRRNSSDLPGSVSILAEASVNSGVQANSSIRFWLHNARWSFKPEEPTE